MILEDLREVCLELKRAGIDYVVVGGAAIERRHRVGTLDIDVAIALRDYERILDVLREHPRVRTVEDLGTMAGCEFRVGTRWVDVELINPKLFCGNRPPDDFIDYVKRHRSERTDVGPVATPGVVWYMRLSVPDWEIYVQKILRDVRAGVPQETLNEVLAIADHFGVRSIVEPRVRRARDVIELGTRR